MSPSARQRLREVRSLPYGTARTAAAESLARRIEADGPRDLLPEALLDLIRAYTFAADGGKSYAVFSHVLRLWDESPELFDADDTQSLFWQLQWVASDLPDYPQITAAQATAFLDDMERRFALAGHGLSVVRRARFEWASGTAAPDVEARRLAWITGERDTFDDCELCMTGYQVSHLVLCGRHEEAISLGLAARGQCDLEPTIIHHALALAALLVGDPDLALDQHLLAEATLSGDRRLKARHRGRTFELLARGGQLDRALRTLRTDDVVLLGAAESPMGHLLFLRGLLAGLSANLDQGTASTGLRDAAHGTVADLRTWARERATALAARFDARNGNGFYSELIEQALAATRTDRPLAFPEAGGSEAVPGVPTANDAGDAGRAITACAITWPVGATHPAPTFDATPSAAGGDARTLLECAETADDRSTAVHAYLAAADAFEAEGLLADAGAAWAEAAAHAAKIGLDEHAHDAFAAAVARLEAGDGDEDVIAAVLAAWAPLAVRLDDPAGILDALDRARDRLRRVAAEASGVGTRVVGTSGNKATCVRASDDGAEGVTEDGRSLALASVRDTLARTLASATPEQIPARLRDTDPAAEALAAAEAFARLDRVADAAHAFWLAGSVARAAGESDAALWSLESAFEGFGVVGQRRERAEVAGELIDALRETGRHEHAERVAVLLAERL